MYKTTLAYIPVAPTARWPARERRRLTKTPSGGGVRTRTRTRMRKRTGVLDSAVVGWRMVYREIVGEHSWAQ